MLKHIFSKLLIVAFVGSVTFWYILTPYLVQPHKRIMNDLLTKSSLTVYGSESSSSEDSTAVTIENWTKWRLYVQTDTRPDEQSQVIYGSSAKAIHVSSKAVIQMEWRSGYQIVIDVTPELGARIDVPILSFNKWGIYNHFIVSVENNVVKIVPRFLFGIPYNTIEDMYGVPPAGEPDPLELVGTEDIVGRIPIIGLFSASNTVDRVIIQIYMGIVLCSIVFLLLVNNPQETVATAKTQDSQKSNVATNCEPAQNQTGTETATNMGSE